MSDNHQTMLPDVWEIQFVKKGTLFISYLSTRGKFGEFNEIITKYDKK